MRRYIPLCLYCLYTLHKDRASRILAYYKDCTQEALNLEVIYLFVYGFNKQDSILINELLHGVITLLKKEPGELCPPATCLYVMLS